jgi:adsorption protein B
MNGLINIMWGMLIFTGILLLLSGIDELSFDVIYWPRYFYRKWKMRKYKALTYEDLSSVREKKIALLIACWDEHTVIAQMLNHNLSAIHYKNYDIFIGAYPNDTQTIDAINSVSKHSPQIHCVVNPKLGPTNKADNLNSMFSFISNYEKENNLTYEIFIIHDSEDIIHPLSFKLYNYLMPRKNLVQLPVFPLEVDLKYFTHWTYNDEFAENHTKNQIAREAIGGFVPSAGVSTAYSRSSIDTLRSRGMGLPFSTSSATEDYASALDLQLANVQNIFVLQSVERVVYKKNIFGKSVPKKIKENVATRAFFPLHYSLAVRQRSRWVLGIAIQEWVRTGWQGNAPTRYTLFHDRKALVSHFGNILGYAVFLFWAGYYIWQLFHPTYPTLQSMLDEHIWVWYLVLACTLLMLERLLQMTIATYRIYGFLAATLCIPRVVYANFINVHALIRAYLMHMGATRKKKPHKWEKTAHFFPDEKLLSNYKRKLGDLLLENKVLTPQQIITALKEQAATGKKLGEILLTTGLIKPDVLLKLIAEQYDMKIINVNAYNVLSEQELGKVNHEDYEWLLRNNLFPIEISANHEVTVAIKNPADEKKKQEVLKKLNGYQVTFALSSDAIK